MSTNDTDLNALYRAANEAVTKAYERRLIDDDLRDANVNWADLGCFQAERYKTHDGQVGVRVYIAEAAPEDRALKDFVQEQLFQSGFPGVDVVTEW